MDVEEFLLWPNSEADLSRMGGKAHALAVLGKSFPIPPWFVVTPQAFHSKGLKKNAERAVETALAKLGSGPYAVRSSAIDEDGSGSSFAGQLQSFLNVKPEDVTGKVEDVWKSAFVDSVKEYRSQRGINAPVSAPGVLVQAMVNAQTAGVAFTVDPVSHDKNRIAVMAVKGLADKLVSGQVNGDTYYIDREDQPVSQELVGKKAVLSETQKSKVAELALKCEKHFGCPQDIEWAFHEGNLYLLQSRPITTLVSKGKTVIWDNSNIVESYSGVTSPLTFSFARYVYAEVYKSFSSLMGVTGREITENSQAFTNMLGHIHGHVYYNLLNWYRVLALYPGFTLNRGFMEQMMGVSEALPQTLAQEIAPIKHGVAAKTLDAVRLARTCLRLFGNALILRYRIASFYNRLSNVLDNPEPPLNQRNLQELGEYYRMLERELLSRWQAPIINDFLCMIAFGVSQKLLKKWCGEKMGQTIHNDFMIGQGDIISAEPSKRIRHMAGIARGNRKLIKSLIEGDINALEQSPELQKEFHEYLAKFGDRCTQELKLESLTLHEDPASLLQAIGFMARKDSGSDNARNVNPESQLVNILEQKRIKKAAALFWGRLAKARIRDRENLRFERTRVFGRVRQICLHIGKGFVKEGLLENERDIFYLQIDEILGAIEGTVSTYDLKGLVDLRCKDQVKFNLFSDLPNRFETSGAVLPYLLKERLRGKTANAEGDSRQGLGCCSGIVKAKVRVVSDPRKEALQSGEILVARHTDPGWIALFSNASGILVERGSLLSHSAIVAREMGIPAIVAIADVMDWLKTGDVVEMDGASGSVVKVKP